MTTSEASDHFCIFDVAGDLFAASATQIREIISTPNYTPVPCTSSVLAGIWHEGSEFLPMLRLPFQNPSTLETETQVLIIHGQIARWGLLVGQVHTIAAIECAMGTDASSEWSNALMGMSTWNNRSVRVLNLDALYQLSEQTLEREWAALTDLNQMVHT